MEKIYGKEILVLENYTKHGYVNTQIHILDEYAEVKINNDILHEFNCRLKDDALIFCNKRNVDAFIKDIPNNSFYVHYYYSIGNKAFNVDKYVKLFNVLLHVIELELGFASSIAWLVFMFLN